MFETYHQEDITLTHDCLNVHGGVPIALLIFVDPI